MERLIYYPNFEPPNDTWLKFAMLYLEEFISIIPEQNIGDVSDNYHRLLEKTDLVSIYSPEPQEGYSASIHAIEETEKFLSNPYRRDELLKGINFSRSWQNQRTWTYEVCRGKFSNEWIYFCQEKNIGRETSKGILLPEELAFLYMAHLASEIAHNKSGAIITDNIRFDNYTNHRRLNTPSLENTHRFTKAIINLIVPQNLENISFAKLIKFRNNNRQLISEFNTQIDNVQDKLSKGYSERDFIKEYRDTQSELVSSLISLGIGITTIPLTSYILFNNTSAQLVNYLKETLSTIGGIYNGTVSLNKALKNNKSKKYCKKYLTSLSSIA